MNSAPLPRPPPIPASPHLKQGMVVMIHDEERAVGGRQPWPPLRNNLPGAPRPHDFLTKCAIEGGKRVAWPPHLGSNEDISSDYEGEPHSQISTNFPPYQNESDHHLGSPPFPSGFKLREEAPMDHVAPPSVVPAQPAFKITQPVRMRTDDKWPPRKSHGGQDETQTQVREFIRPSKGNRDYGEFFAQNALPNSYPSYRAPPGTQHHGLV